jgi:LPS O-antigen subunit length determinant protein (WzzB/FepE family)
MADRILDTVLYLLDRAWTVCTTLLVLAAIGMATAFLAPASHTERVVISLKSVQPLAN